VWAILPVVFFSFAQTKLPNYVALVLPACAIVVGLWFDRLADAIDRRAAIVSAATIPLFVGLLWIAIAVFIRTNHLEGATAVIGPPAAVLGVVLLLGSLATVVAIARVRWTAFAPYVLGVTAGVLILFIAFVGEPAAEALKPIPPLAAAIDAQRDPHAAVAIRGVAGSYALIFYTAPPVLDVDDQNDAAFVAALCANPDLYLVTHAADVAKLSRLATAHGRRAAQLSERRGVAVLHLDGPPCVEGSGASM
jgi:4-amino-4-deoxy-L-arabinose transferase-like glycosyltransferase